MNILSLHILVADDDRPYCVLLKKALTGRGHAVSMSNSGDEAINRLQKESFDIVLLDYKMEGTNGIDVLQWMHSKNMNIPVILITAYGSNELFEEAFKWGAVEYFAKGEMDTVRLPVLVEQAHKKYQLRKKRPK